MIYQRGYLKQFKNEMSDMKRLKNYTAQRDIYLNVRLLNRTSNVLITVLVYDLFLLKTTLKNCNSCQI